MNETLVLEIEVEALRGSGATGFRSSDAVRDDRGIALAADALDLLDAIGLERVTAIVTLALAYQPRRRRASPTSSASTRRR
ncbi:MAG TPA: hypothetical protein VMJ65_08825 [Solirubrobacteraceae bacterium]|nr:hypothetical protein [Solirubrobacteraceae bacterium]